MRKSCVFLSFALSILAMFTFSIREVSANSAQTYFLGTDSAGVAVIQKESPVVVEREELIFEINSLSNPYDTNKMDMGNVTARYSFYNPSELTITSTLLFPFGKNPYGYDWNDEMKDNYEISLNGKAVEKSIRYIVYDENATDGKDFSVKDSFLSYSDKKMSTHFFNSDTKVTVYSFSCENIDKAEESACIGFEIDEKMQNRKVCLKDMNSFQRSNKNKFKLGKFIKYESFFDVFVFGEPYEAFPKIKIYKDASLKKEIGGSVELVKRKTLTFDEFVMSFYNAENSPISELDWYNAMIVKMDKEGWDNSYLRMDYIHFPSMMTELTSCYEYNLTFKPGERCVNEVIAPLYPAIDLHYEPSIYIYNYLLSPAKTWKEFGGIDITIKTPFYMTGFKKGYNFERKEGKYVTHLDGLLDEDLSFELSTGEKPVKIHSGCGCT